MSAALLFGSGKISKRKDTVAPRVVSREQRVQITTQSGAVLDGFAEDRGGSAAIVLLHSVCLLLLRVCLTCILASGQWGIAGGDMRQAMATLLTAAFAEQGERCSQFSCIRASTPTHAGAYT
jgi:hypothetical protein